MLREEPARLRLGGPPQTSLLLTHEADSGSSVLLWGLRGSHFQPRKSVGWGDGPRGGPWPGLGLPVASKPDCSQALLV